MKKWILTAVVLVIAGAVICFAAAASMGFDLRRLDTGKYETNTYEVSEPFTAVAVDIDAGNVVIRPSEDGMCKVVCLEEEKQRHDVKVENGTLRIRHPEWKEDFFHFGVSIGETEITVYLPEGSYSALSVQTDSGDISIESLHVENIALETDTGDIRLQSIQCTGVLRGETDTGEMHVQDVNCGNLNSEGETGNITLERVMISGNCSIDRDSGDVVFQDSDAGEISVETDSGDVTGTLLSEKVFLTETDTGDVQVPQTIQGGTCRISTDTGDIRIEIR
jgi:DUF4097 and DUF4098 domain-containing protein YvlB